ncbi:MAG: hypothetical protein JNJ59_00415 [Deltaproteobacteria bacterium]|nr:hypothetical protein [Deltaproteobacteria bacterium]
MGEESPAASESSPAEVKVPRETERAILAELVRIHAELRAAQTPMDPEIARLLYENLAEFYL